MNFTDYHIHIIKLEHLRKFLKKIKNEMKSESLDGNIINNTIFSFPTHNYMFNFRDIIDISKYYKLKIIPSFSIITEENIEITIFVFIDNEIELLKIIEEEKIRWIIFILEELKYRDYLISPYELSKMTGKRFQEIEKNDIAEYLLDDELNNFYNLDEVNENILFEIFKEFPFKQFSLDFILNFRDYNCRYYLTNSEDEEIIKKYKLDGIIHENNTVIKTFKNKGYSTFYGSGRNIYFIGDQEADLIL